MKQRHLIFSLLLLLLTVPFCPGTLQAQQIPKAPPPPDSSEQIALTIVGSEKPVFIDFWAAWCKPCKLLNPIVKKLEAAYGNKVLFMKIDTEQHRAISNYFRIQSIPAVFMVKDREVVSAIIGVRSYEEYAREIEKVLAIPEKEPEPDSTGGSPGTVE